MFFYYIKYIKSTMEIKSFQDRVLLSTKRDVLKVHLYTNLLKNNIKPIDSHMDIILELYLCGGYKGREEQRKFIQSCLDKEYMKSDQSVRNVFSVYTDLKVFIRERNTHLRLSDEYIPKVECDKLVLQHVVSHLN